MTQAEAAAALGVGLRTFAAWERGERDPGPSRVLAMERLLEQWPGAST